MRTAGAGAEHGGGWGGRGSVGSVHRGVYDKRNARASGSFAGECDLAPVRLGGELEEAGEVGQLLDLGGEHGAFDDVLVAQRALRLEVAAQADGPGHGVVGTDDLALADQAGGELGGAAVLARGAAQIRVLPQFSTIVRASASP